MKRKILSLIAFAMLFITIYSKDNDFKFGKIDISELTNMTCPIDSNAEAYVIADIGRTYFSYNDNSGFDMKLERKTRIKFLKKTSFDYATFTIPIWNLGSTFENIDIKGFSYNLENGEIIKSKLTGSSQYEEVVWERLKTIKVTFPNIKEGSVIDLQYTITSNYLFNIREWRFQDVIPILYSEYTFEKPEYFRFKQFSNGWINIDIQNEETTGSINFVETYRTGPNDAMGHYMKNYTLTYNLFITKYSAKNVPSFRNEKFTNSYTNYISSIYFDLLSINFPGKPVLSYSKDWKTITKELLDDEYLGRRLESTAFIKDTLESLLLNTVSKLDKAKVIYEYVQKRMKYKNYDYLFCFKSLKKIHEQKAGFSSEINLLLTLMLREAGLNAYPVILSTRNNGLVLTSYPIITKYNSVICLVEIDGNQILLDATDSNISFGMLPFRCLNGEGYLLDYNLGKPINLSPIVNNTSATINKLKLDKNGLFSGNIQKTYKNYGASNQREYFKSFKSNDEFLRKYQDTRPGLTIGTLEVKDIDSINKPCIFNFKDIQLINKCEITDSLISFNPMLFEQLNENPFKSPSRKYPVDYGYGYDDNYILQLEIPEGYIVDELPKPYSMLLPDNAGKFTYNISENNGKIQMARRFIISKTLFTESEYAQLKEFYKQMIEKEAQMIVLKKK